MDGGRPISAARTVLDAVERRRRNLRPIRTAAVSAALILLVGVLGLGLNAPMLYPSLGPTAYLLVHDANHRTASFRNTVAGHLLALISGVFAVEVFGYQHAPGIFSPSAHLTDGRVAAAVLALGLTVMLALWLRASHPPAGSTALVIVLGGFRVTAQGVFAIAAGVLAIALAGEALRRLKLIGVPPDASPISPGRG